ncbi:hypothetical protein A1sIA56_01160 [Candidatus Planktophila sulfonica]|uniref:Uncharacterized protein n=2 Tax=Candidatus Planktophila sulfonica TaxID=1884904 RepID=A0A249KIJ3_9ACTN|nr:hypothetical protein A1sIA56_01160 [Candidatus Planktophila sulfonica]
MGAYAALAAGLINLRYQTGSDSNMPKSLLLIIPGSIVLGLSLTTAGKKLLDSKSAAAVGMTVGLLLFIYSFVV